LPQSEKIWSNVHIANGSFPVVVASNFSFPPVYLINDKKYSHKIVAMI